MDTPLISVIVPVYKVEQYIDRCVQSITDQTYRNLEIILVDDGSPDHCPAMCDAWAAKDSRIKVMHKENGGLSDARNAGMAVASGTYMGFVDSDDYIAPEMYQLLYDRITVDGSDIAACGVEMVYEDGTSPRKLTASGNCVLNKDAAMEAIIRENWLKQPVWHKLYKTELIRDILFPVGKYHEDIFWSYQAIARVQKVSVVDTTCYFYVQRSGSIMGERYSIRRLDAIEAKQQRMHYLQREFPELEGRGQLDLLFSCIYHGQLAQRDLPKAENKRVMTRLKSVIKDCPMPSEEIRNQITATHRFWLHLAKINLPLTCALRGLLGVGL